MKLAPLLIALVLTLSAGVVEAKPQHGNPCVAFYVEAMQDGKIERVGLKVRDNCAGR